MTPLDLIRKKLQENSDNLAVIALKKSQYVLQTDIPMQVEKEEGRLIRERDALLSDLETLKKTEPQVHRNTGEGQRQQVEFNKIHLDRNWEITTFGQIVGGQEVNPHVLLIKAVSGMGKTALMNKFWDIANCLRRARVDFKDPEMSICRFIGEMMVQLDEEGFLHMRSVYQDLSKDAPFMNMASIPTVSSYVEVALGKQSRQQQEYSRGLILDMFLMDLAEIHRFKSEPIVILIDTFEKASEELRIWVAKRFLDRLRKIPWLICVTAGQEVPQIETDAEDWCLQHELGILPYDYIQEYVRMFKPTASDDLISYIAASSGGKPFTLQQCTMLLLNQP